MVTYGIGANPDVLFPQVGGKIFNYSPAAHNVVAVNRVGYDSCTGPKGKVYRSGKDRIKLVKGQNFFICSFAGHCQAGMKIAINAL
ncbi:Basic blue protein, putative [Ricinus communis]|uniref:Basic blue protein, putative n=1 Tax=Ricinus communis TaxID=3988 RepID=B9SRJ1_RICCO|nr:Basic blue protein, putative [Ricinus communis]